MISDNDLARRILDRPLLMKVCGRLFGVSFWAAIFLWIFLGFSSAVPAMIYFVLWIAGWAKAYYSLRMKIHHHRIEKRAAITIRKQAIIENGLKEIYRKWPELRKYSPKS